MAPEEKLSLTSDLHTPPHIYDRNSHTHIKHHITNTHKVLEEAQAKYCIKSKTGERTGEWVGRWMVPMGLDVDMALASLGAQEPAEMHWLYITATVADTE